MDFIVFCIFVFIQSYHTKDVGATCGRLTYQEPAIQGRIVTFVFSPDNFQQNSNLTMLFYKLGGNQQERHFPFYINDSVYYIHVDTRTNVFKSATFYVNYGGPYSDPKKITLIELKGCGHMYVRTKPVVSGRNFELGYFPKDVVIPSTHDYVREWYNVTSGDVMVESECILTERNETNREYVLTVYNARSWMSGMYKIKCTTGRPTNVFTNAVDISVIVPPGKPSLHSSIHVSDCEKCVVGKESEALGESVYCITTGGTVPTIKIGGRNVSVYTSFDDRYHPNYVTRKGDHMKVVSCSVNNAAIDTPLVSNSTLYVAVKPAEPVLHLPTLKEREPANITCTSTGGRPASRLSLMIDGKNMSESSETISVNDTTTNTFTIRTTLHSNAKREWNLKYICCTQQTELFDDKVSDRGRIICKYPPLTLFMEKPTLPTGLQEVYSLTVTCNISDFNDNCSFNWNSDQLELDGTKATFRTEETEGHSTLIVNATKRDNGNTLLCSVTCSSFQVDLSASHTIYVPFAPIMSLSSEQEIFLAERETQQVTCTVNSYPMSDIIWSSGDTRIMEDCKQTKLTNECIATIEHIAVNEQRNYTCTAQHQFKNVTEYVVVTGRARRERTSTGSVESGHETSGNTLLHGVAAGLAGLVLLTATVVLTIYIRKRKKRAERSGEQTDPNGVQYNVNREADDSTLNDEVTYAQVVKPRSVLPNRTGIVTETQEKITDALIYAELDMEHLEAAREATTKHTPSAPTEYVDINFATRPQVAEEENVYAN